MKGKKDGKIILMLGCLAFMFVSHAYGIAWTNTGYEFGVYNPEGVSYNVDTQDLDWGFTNHDLKTYSTDILRIMSGTSGNFIGSGGWCTHQKFNFNDGAMVCEYTIEDNPTVNTHNQSNATNSRSGGLAANPSILTTPLPAGKPGEMEIYPIASVDCNKAWVLGVRYGNKGGGFFYLRTPKPYTNLCDWMAALPEDATLKELYLPGAHDAATEYNGGRFIPIAPLLLLDVVNPVVQIADFLVNYYEFMAEGKDATASCQKYNFLDMLNQGTRYFDMRVVKRTSMVTLSSLGTETKTADLSDADKYITKNTSRSNSDLLLFKNIVTYGVDVPHVTDSSGAVMMSVHGNPCITYDTMDDLMRQVETFSLNHPSEIIVLGFQQIDVQSGSSPLALPLDAEGDATPNDPPLWAKTLYDTLEKDHHLLIRPSDKVTHNSTLQQLRASNSGTGRIFVVVRDKVYAAYKDSTIEGTNYKVSDLFFDMGAVIQSPYGDQQSSYTDQAKSMAGFIDTNKGKDTIFVNQAQMTATNVNYAGDLLLGKTLYDFTGTYYLDMIKTLISERHTMGSYPSVILYDFVNANVNRFIIDWNFANMAIQPPPLPGFNAGQLYAYAEAYDYSADVAQGQDVSNAKLCFAAIGDTLFRTQQKYDPLTAQNNTAIFSSPPNTYMGALSADAVFIEDNADAMSANLSAEQGSGGSYNNPKVLLSFIAKDPNSGVRTLYGAIGYNYIPAGTNDPTFTYAFKALLSDPNLIATACDGTNGRVYCATSTGQLHKFVTNYGANASSTTFNNPPYFYTDFPIVTQGITAPTPSDNPDITVQIPPCVDLTAVGEEVLGIACTNSNYNLKVLTNKSLWDFTIPDEQHVTSKTKIYDFPTGILPMGIAMDRTDGQRLWVVDQQGDVLPLVYSGSWCSTSNWAFLTMFGGKLLDKVKGNPISFTSSLNKLDNSTPGNGGALFLVTDKGDKLWAEVPLDNNCVQTYLVQ